MFLAKISFLYSDKGLKEGIILVYLGLIMIACLFLYLHRASFSLVPDSKLQLPIKRMDKLIVFAPFVTVVVFSILFLRY